MMRDRHLVGAGAAACAVCCAPPLLAAIGIVGGAAAITTALFAGVVFGLVVGVATLAIAWRRRRRAIAASCAPAPGDVQDLELLPPRVSERP
jgi:hypothetical protein